MNNQQKFLINGGLDQGISPLDRGLSYGDGVFRTFRVVNGLAMDWPLHYQRLVQDCVAIGIVCPSAELLMSDIAQLFLTDETAIAKIIVTRGEGARGYAPPAVTMPTRIVTKSAMLSYAKHYDEGVRLFKCKTILSYQAQLAGVKHLNRLENVLARAEWNDPNYMDGLMLDVEGYAIECTSANIFARYGTQLHTPLIDRCGVAGVTRQSVINLAYLAKLTPIIKNIQYDDLLQADEIIICNSVFGALQVRAIADKQWPMTKLAADIRRLLAGK